MLYFDIDGKQLDAVASELGATDRQVRLAFSRALSRTAATLRKLSEREIRDELKLRAIKFLRIRLKTVKLRRNGGDGFKLWYGLNDMPVGEFKGKPIKTAAGASFRGVEFKGGFLGRNKRRQPTVFKRVGAARLPIAEQELPVKGQLDVLIEDKIFVQAESIFWRHFVADLNARVKFAIGAA